MTLGRGQAPVLIAILNRHPWRPRAGWAGVWVAASAIGGVLDATAATRGRSTTLYLTVERAVGDTGALVMWQTVLTALLYGIPTALVLIAITYSAAVNDSR